MLENVLVPTLVAAAPDDHARRARTLLERVGLGDRLEHRPAELSGGEKQRAALARALVLRPRCCSATSPPATSTRTPPRVVADLLLELHRAEPSVLVLVTHSAELAARLPRRLRTSGRRLEPA